MATVAIHVVYEVEVPELDEFDLCEEDAQDEYDGIMRDIQDNYDCYLDGNYTSWCECVEEC